MFEVELEFLNQKQQRHHQDKNFHKYRKYSLTRSIIYKQLNSYETCSDYISNVRNKTIDEFLLLDKNIKEDPFGIIGHLNKYRFYKIEYSLNKKKRWLIPKVLSENIETYQKPELNLTVSLVTITPHRTMKYIGYSSNERKICTNRYPSPGIVYCEQRDGHKKLKKWEHDISILYVTEVERIKKRFKCHEGRACSYCYPPRPKPTFDKNDIYDYESCPMDDLLSFEENENIEPLIPTSTYSLEDFIVNKKKKEKRLNKKKLSPKILDCGVFPKNEYEDLIFPEKLVPQETRKTPKNKAMPSYYLSKIDYKNYALEKWLSKVEICDQIYPTVALISINNFESMNSNLNHITNDEIFKEFEGLRNFSLIARNIHDKEKRSYYFQHNSPKDSKKNSIKNTKIKIESIFPSILPASSFLKTECHSIEEAKKKAIFLTFNLANPNKIIPPKPGFICRVCYIDDSDEQSGFALAKCMHYFCLECWHNHVELAISIRNVPIGCMEQGCTNIVMPEIFNFFFKQDLVDKYANMISERRMMKKDFIGCHRCDQILFLDNLNYDLLENKLSICECGQIYCVNCSQKVHIPLTCEERRLFGGTEQFLSLHMSEAALCPGCGGLVDKTDGCNHMTCRCGFQFCYVCGGTWNWGHKCGVWKKKITRSPILMIDKDIEKLFNLHPTANEVAIWRFNQIAIWRQKREYKNLWYLRKVYRKKTDDWLAMKVVLQYAQICQLIEYVHIKQCLYLSQKHKRKNSKHKQIFDLVNRLDYILEKLLDPSNDPEEILQRVFNLSTNLISLC